MIARGPLSRVALGVSAFLLTAGAVVYLIDLQPTVWALGYGVNSTTGLNDPESNVPQPLPFSFNLTDPGLINANDNWSGVPGIEGYFLRNDAVATTGVDPRTILGDTFGMGTTTVELDVAANQPRDAANTATFGGIAEFHADAQGNPFNFPIVALQPDSVADAPFLIMNINTTGRTNINVGYVAYDIDCSSDDAVQLVVTQFRIGNTGNFTNVPGEFVHDVTGGPNLCTLTSFMGGTLPAAANNQPLVQIRIITANAEGPDEWVGIDFIEITGTGTGPSPTPTPSATPTPGPPTLSINNVSQFEGDIGNTIFTFTVTRTGSLLGASSASYTTAAGTATGTGPVLFPFDDYLSESGVVNFGPGDAAKPITITVFGDSDFEADETFNVNLANPIGATITDGSGLGTIENDDGPPPTPFPLVINEVDSDTAGSDTLEFIELYAGGLGGVSLAGHIVVLYDGADDRSYASFDLDGFSTNAAGYFTLGNAAVPGVDLVIPNGLLQDGADAVALYTSASNFANGTPVVTVNLRDAVVYDTTDADDPGLLPLLVAGGQINENDAGNGEVYSIQRCPNGAGAPRDSSNYRATTPTADGRNICGGSPGGTGFDYDGDGTTDFSVFRPSNGTWYLQRSNAGFLGLQFGAGSDKLTPADYDGDGKTDIAVYRPSAGQWYVLNSATSTVAFPLFGIAEDVPTPGDYDGDGKADISVFRPSQGTWYRQNSSNGTFFGFQFGAPGGDVPTVGDFDGDGRNDLGIWRPSNGDWYNYRSSDGGVFGERFGQTGDKIAPADYDGDGKTDIAIFRPSTGQWVVRNSATATYSFSVFGASGDVPVAGDYDGDGRADIGVWRPENGTWYVQRSSNGEFIVFPWGQNGDVPTPSAFGN